MESNRLPLPRDRQTFAFESIQLQMIVRESVLNGCDRILSIKIVIRTKYHVIEENIIRKHIDN